jgi:hypothetical protein
MSKFVREYGTELVNKQSGKYWQSKCQNLALNDAIESLKLSILDEEVWLCVKNNRIWRLSTKSAAN